MILLRGQRYKYIQKHSSLLSMHFKRLLCFRYLDSIALFTGSLPLKTLFQVHPHLRQLNCKLLLSFYSDLFSFIFLYFWRGWDRRGCFSDSICEIMPVGLLREHKIFLHSRLITLFFFLLVMTNDPSCSSIIIVAA